MTGRRNCCECGSFDTEQVDLELDSEMVREGRICDECSAEFMNIYRLVEKRFTTPDKPSNHN